jgi:hypothetical protein
VADLAKCPAALAGSADQGDEISGLNVDSGFAAQRNVIPPR